MTQYAVTDPRTGERVRDVPTDTDEQVLAAVGAAHDAFTSWGRTSSVADRAKLVRRVSELHTERREELAGAMNREMGKAMDDALGEVDFSAAIYGYYADHAEEFLADEEIPLLEGEGRAVVRRRPLGVILGIMPWNYPAYQVARFAGPNLTAGNSVVLKHAPQCPESAAILAQMFKDAGFPEGAYVNVYASNEQIEEIIGDPRIQGVSLTGSERAGSAVAATAGRHLKKVVLELGGSDPFIVLGSDDLDATVDAAVEARMENTGQACNAGKRFIVAEDLHDDFVARFTAKMLERETGPLSSVAAADRLEGQVKSAVAGAPTSRRTASDTARSTPAACSPASARTARRSIRSCSDPWRWCSRPRTRPRRSSSPTTRRTGWAPTSTPTTRTRPPGSPTRSMPAWSSSTASAPRGSSCRSAA
jgi:succinate-semialdehyde dehydrogenase/glutarate-semialdehyde dehydrogenase